MKRYGNLWDRVISFENLYNAFRKAVLGKRGRASVIRFVFDCEEELLKLREELRTKTYTPGDYHTFYIYDRKKRMISAADFRDRIVHHALCNVIEPIFDRTFIHDLYSNRKEKGVHRAVKRARKFAGKYPYVLKCDIGKYFPSVDHRILKRILRGKIKCAGTLWLADLIIDNSNPQKTVPYYYPGDDLFTPYERRKGLPIGNQTSQFFSNLYLSPMDHFIKENLKVAGYARYVDDFLLFGTGKAQIWEWKNRVEHFLNDFRLSYKQNGVQLFRVQDGFPFLGYRILPYAILVSRQAILRYRRKADRYRKMRRREEADLKTIRQFVFGVMGHFCQADSRNLIGKLLLEKRY